METARAFFSDVTAERLQRYIESCLPLYNRSPIRTPSSAPIERREVARHWVRGEWHTFDFTHALALIRCPTLVLAGAHQPVLPIEGRRSSSPAFSRGALAPTSPLRPSAPKTSCLPPNRTDRTVSTDGQEDVWIRGSEGQAPRTPRASSPRCAYRHYEAWPTVRSARTHEGSGGPAEGLDLGVSAGHRPWIVGKGRSEAARCAAG
jgi:hypothetical protein